MTQRALKALQQLVALHESNIPAASDQALHANAWNEAKDALKANDEWVSSTSVPETAARVLCFSADRKRDKYDVGGYIALGECIWDRGGKRVWETEAAERESRFLVSHWMPIILPLGYRL